MKLDAKTVARLVLPEGKTDAIFFDDDLPDSESGYAPAVAALGLRSIERAGVRGG